MIRRRWWTICASLVLAACGTSVDTPGEPLRLLSEPLPAAFLGEPYEANLRAVGGLRPFTFTLSEGALPGGLELAQGAVVGTPSETGRFPFTVTITDAALNKTFEEYALSVTEVPPPELTYNVPATQIQRRVTLRVDVDGRDVRGFRTRATWDADAFAFVDGSLTHGAGVAVFHEVESGVLRADVAALGTSLSGTVRVFSFELEPLMEAPTLSLTTTTEFLARNRAFFSSGVEGAPVTPTPGVDDGDTQEPNEPADETAAP